MKTTCSGCRKTRVITLVITYENLRDSKVTRSRFCADCAFMNDFEIEADTAEPVTNNKIKLKGVTDRVVADLIALSREIKSNQKAMREFTQSLKGKTKGSAWTKRPKRTPDKDGLLDADPKCKHKIVDAPGGGIKCTKCSGWFCY